MGIEESPFPPIEITSPPSFQGRRRRPPEDGEAPKTLAGAFLVLLGKFIAFVKPFWAMPQLPLPLRMVRNSIPCLRVRQFSASAVGADLANQLKGKSAEEIGNELGVNIQVGLTEARARMQRSKFGPNAVPERVKNPFVRVMSYFVSPLALIMALACVMSLVFLDVLDTVVILGLLVFNAAIGYYEERKADVAVANLRAKLENSVQVLRDGRLITVPITGLVPLDIVQLHIGAMFPADMIAIEAVESLVDESSLTGESLPVSKNPGDLCYSGAVLKAGDVRGIVTATGAGTFFGRAAALSSGGGAQGNVQKLLRRMTIFCIMVLILGAFVQLVVQFGIRQKSCTGVLSGDCEPISNVLVLIVGGVPVAAPAVFSIILALGGSALSEHGAIVTRLSALEELGGVSILCSDKTGTLTLNKLTVCDAVPLDEDLPPHSIMCAAYFSAAHPPDDAIDTAVTSAAQEMPAVLAVHENAEMVRFEPFNPENKRTIALVKLADGSLHGYAKGAPRAILALLSEADRKKHADFVQETMDAQGSRGYRVIAVAETSAPIPEANIGDSATWTWNILGLLPLFDPPREDTAETIRECVELGLSVKMITGDQRPIAVETARQLSIGQNIFVVSTTAGGHSDDGIHVPESQLRKKAILADGFAEVLPEHKFGIVTTLRSAGYSVMMTGDGVNDAPALRAANVGIAVDDATDAARAAADLVLTEPGLHVVVDAVVGAREIFQRMRAYAAYALSNVVRIAITFTALTALWDFDLPTISVVLIAALNDLTILTISFDRTRPSPRPLTWNMSELFVFAVASAIYSSICTSLLYVALRDGVLNNSFLSITTPTDDELRALVYLHVSITGQLVIFSTRSQHFFWWSPPSAILLLSFFVAQGIATMFALVGAEWYPLGDPTMSAAPGVLVVVVWAYAAILFPGIDSIKLASRWFVSVTINPTLAWLEAFQHAVLEAKGATVDAWEGLISEGREIIAKREQNYQQHSSSA